MDFTVEVAKAFSLSPFLILNEDKDRVIMMINYFVEKGHETGSESAAVNKHENKRARGKTDRIRVNDKTATGGWF